VKIEVNKIPAEGWVLSEEIEASRLEADSEIAQLGGPVKATARVSRITNAVTVELSLEAPLAARCSRCLAEFRLGLEKKITLNYPVDRTMPFIDLDPEIREEIILEYPLKPVCKNGCLGLCPKCGRNLNEGKCDCS
jgi:uncharacterized protein